LRAKGRVNETKVVRVGAGFNGLFAGLCVE